SIVQQSRTKLANAVVQPLFEIDVDVFGPEVLAELFACDEFASAFHQFFERAIGLGLKPDGLAVAQQFAAAHVELKNAETVSLRHRDFLIVSVPQPAPYLHEIKSPACKSMNSDSPRLPLIGRT